MGVYVCTGNATSGAMDPMVRATIIDVTAVEVLSSRRECQFPNVLLAVAVAYTYTHALGSNCDTAPYVALLGFTAL